MAPDGTSRTRIATLTDADSYERCAETFDLGPVWSPDGTRLAILIENHVWVANADGTNHSAGSLHRFDRQVGSAYGIAWRPVP